MGSRVRAPARSPQTPSKYVVCALVRANAAVSSLQFSCSSLQSPVPQSFTHALGDGTGLAFHPHPGIAVTLHRQTPVVSRRVERQKLSVQIVETETIHNQHHVAFTARC